MINSKNMKTLSSVEIRSLALSFLLLASGAVGDAQTLLQPGTPVVGQCLNKSDPGCVIPNLFGPGGITLFNNPAFPHFAHFIGSAQETLNQGVGTAIATQLAILPIVSPSSGFTFKYDSSAGVFVRSTTSFGPIYTERAETIGRGKFAFGTSYQRFRFSSLDGINLRNVPAVFTHIPDTGNGGAVEAYESDVIKTNNSLDLNMDQTVFYGTVGITDRLDVSVSIPFVSVRFGAASAADIIRVSGQSFYAFPGATSTTVNPHEFDANGSLTNSYAANGSASGIGDVTFRVKGNIYRGENIQVAAVVDIRTASGNAREFLGSGATGIKPFLAISSGNRFSPHLNLGYQWNGSSILAGNLTGTTLSEVNTVPQGAAPGTAPSDQVAISNGSATTGRLPSQIIYSLGFDFGATRRLTLAADYLGQTLINTPRVFQTTYNTQPPPLSLAPAPMASQPLPTITAGKDTIGVSSGSVGFKYNLFSQFLLTGNILFRLDNKGLRQDVTPMVALSYAFGK
jgi:hypothetical protein